MVTLKGPPVARDDHKRFLEQTFHLTKLTLLEIGPLVPFLGDRDELNVLEVGGNVGLWCECFHNVFGPQIASYEAFEPMPGNIALFKDRLARYMPQAKVDIVEACAGDAQGRVTIHFDAEVTTLASVPVTEVHRADGSLLVSNQLSREVDQIRLDDRITSHVDLIKIDTEGYEWNVIAGMSEAIDAGLVDNIYFEIGRHQAELGQSFQQFYDFFHERGWQVYRQVVGRNYFGLNEIRRYAPRFEEELLGSMFMILATRTGESPSYVGPRVTGKAN
jgi:FkbM family methyltransferase